MANVKNMPVRATRYKIVTTSSPMPFTVLHAVKMSKAATIRYFIHAPDRVNFANHRNALPMSSLVYRIYQEARDEKQLASGSTGIYPSLSQMTKKLYRKINKNHVLKRAWGLSSNCHCTYCESLSIMRVSQ